MKTTPLVLELLLTILDVHTLRCLIEHVCFPFAELMHVILGHCRWCASTRTCLSENMFPCSHWDSRTLFMWMLISPSSPVQDCLNDPRVAFFANWGWSEALFCPRLCFVVDQLWWATSSCAWMERWRFCGLETIIHHSSEDVLERRWFFC